MHSQRGQGHGCLFEEVGDFSDFMVVVCEGGLFFGFVVGIVCEFFVAYVFSVLL
jgi:hypothetical protein